MERTKCRLFLHWVDKYFKSFFSAYIRFQGICMMTYKSHNRQIKLRLSCYIYLCFEFFYLLFFYLMLYSLFFFFLHEQICVHKLWELVLVSSHDVVLVLFELLFKGILVPALLPEVCGTSSLPYISIKLRMLSLWTSSWKVYSPFLICPFKVPIQNSLMLQVSELQIQPPSHRHTLGACPSCRA